MRLIDLKRKAPHTFQYIKDYAVAIMLDEVKPRTNYKKQYKYFKRALSNYISFRLAIMQNKEVTEIEHTLLTAAIKVGVQAAIKEYKINSYCNTTDVDKIVDRLAPEVLNAVHEQRVKLFTKLLEQSAKGIE